MDDRYAAPKVFATAVDQLHELVAEEVGSTDFGSDDYLQVVLNGREIHRSKAPRGALPGQDKVAASFKKGDNVLLFKVVDEGGAFTFCFRAKGAHGRSGRWPNIPASIATRFRVRS